MGVKLVPDVDLSTSIFAALLHCYLLKKHAILGIVGKACISAFQGKHTKLLYLNYTVIDNFLCLKKSKIPNIVKNNKTHFAYITGTVSDIAKLLTVLSSAW